MFDMKERKALRLSTIVEEDAIISTRLYNTVIGIVVLYGLLLNIWLVNHISEINSVLTMGPWAMFFLYIGCVCAGTIITFKSKNPLVSFLGYNLVVMPVGILLTQAIPGYPIEEITIAIANTIAITIAMILVSTLFPQLFQGLGMTLFVSLFAALMIEVIVSILGYSVGIFNYIFVGLFSLYLGYDWSRAQAYPKTFDNAVDSALDIYLDIINLFIRILQIVAKNKK